MDRIEQIARTNPAIEFQREVVETFNAWMQQFPDSANQVESALARAQGQSGQPLLWQTTGPLDEDAAKSFVAQLTQGDTSLRRGLHDGQTDTRIADATDGSIQLKSSSDAHDASVWLAWTPVHVSEQTEIEILT